MNDTPTAPFAFVPASPKGQRAADASMPLEPLNRAPTDAPTKRTRRTKAEMQSAEQINPFDEFDRVFSIMAALPKPVRERILATLNRIYP